MKKIVLLLLSLFTFLIASYSYADINNEISVLETEVRELYFDLDEAERELFLEFRSLMVDALSNEDDPELLNSLLLTVKEVIYSRDHWNLEELMLKFTKEWIIKRIRFLWWDISNDYYEINQDSFDVSDYRSESTQDFYQKKYDNRLKEYDDLILNFQRSMLDELHTITEVVDNWYELWDSFVLDYEFDLLLDIVWDFSYNIDLSFANELTSDYISDRLKSELDFYLSMITDLPDLYDADIEFSADFILDWDEAYVKVNNYDLSDIIDDSQDEDLEYIVSIFEELDWDYLKLDEEYVPSQNFDISQIELDEIYYYEKKLEDLYDLIYNEPIFSVYEELWDWSYKLFYNKNIIPVAELVDQHEYDYDYDEFLDDFTRNYRNNDLVMNDLSNWKYSLQDRYDESDDYEFVFSENWLERIYFPHYDRWSWEEVWFFEYSKSGLEDGYNIQNYYDYWYWDEVNLLLWYDVNNSALDIDILLETYFLDINSELTISNDWFQLNASSTDISEDFNQDLSFFLWINPWLESISLDINSSYDFQDQNNIAITVPNNYKTVNDISVIRDHMSNSRDMTRRSELNQLSSALSSYWRTNAVYPSVDWEFVEVKQIEDYLQEHIFNMPYWEADYDYYYIDLKSRWSLSAWYALLTKVENEENWNFSADSISQINDFMESKDYESTDISQELWNSWNFYILVN